MLGERNRRSGKFHRDVPPQRESDPRFRPGTRGRHINSSPFDQADLSDRRDRDHAYNRSPSADHRRNFSTEFVDDANNSDVYANKREGESIDVYSANLETADIRNLQKQRPQSPRRQQDDWILRDVGDSFEYSDRAWSRGRHGNRGLSQGRARPLAREEEM